MIDDIADVLACYKSWFWIGYRRGSSIFLLDSYLNYDRLTIPSRLLAKRGYAVALVTCDADSLKTLFGKINAAGVTAAPFPISSRSTTDVNSAYARIHAQYQGQPIRVTVYDVWKPFLNITPEDVQGVSQTNLEGAFAFSKNVIEAFQVNQIDEKGKRGSLIFTGATASVRGNVTTSAFSARKHVLRALSQSLAKEFSKQKIHVSHAIIDSSILTSSARERRSDREWEQNEDVRLSPDGILIRSSFVASGRGAKPHSQYYLYLIEQPRSAWTWELDLCPAHEKC